jgi:hypothetical protein
MAENTQTKINHQSPSLLEKIIHKIQWTFFRQSGTTQVDPQVKVYIISYPKSGRTWLRVLLGKIICEKYNLDEKDILNTIRLTLKAGITTINWIHDGSGLGEGPHFVRFSTDKSIFKDKKVIFLYRDPKDVIVSSYFHATKRIKEFTDYNGTLSDFIRSRGYGIEKLLNFYNIWYKNQNVPEDFLLVKYEDLHTNPHQSLNKVLDFIGIQNVEDELIDNAIKYASFKNMKKMEANNQFESEIVKPKIEGDDESYKVRKGKVGGYVDYLSQEDIEYMDKVISKIGCLFSES